MTEAGFPGERAGAPGQLAAGSKQPLMLVIVRCEPGQRGDDPRRAVAPLDADPAVGRLQFVVVRRRPVGQAVLLDGVADGSPRRRARESQPWPRTTRAKACIPQSRGPGRGTAPPCLRSAASKAPSRGRTRPRARPRSPARARASEPRRSSDAARPRPASCPRSPTSAHGARRERWRRSVPRVGRRSCSTVRSAGGRDESRFPEVQARTGDRRRDSRGRTPGRDTGRSRARARRARVAAARRERGSRPSRQSRACGGVAARPRRPDAPASRRRTRPRPRPTISRIAASIAAGFQGSSRSGSWLSGLKSASASRPVP